MLGLALQASGDAPGAIEALHRAVELDPQDARPLEITAAMLASSNRRDEAITDLRRARAVRNSDALDELSTRIGAASE
jgi:Flp pilus assembly protein TadD